jgi:hypothetical protein
MGGPIRITASASASAHEVDRNIDIFSIVSPARVRCKLAPSFLCDVVLANNGHERRHDEFVPDAGDALIESCEIACRSLKFFSPGTELLNSIENVRTLSQCGFVDVNAPS